MSPEPKPRSMAAVTITVNSRWLPPVAVNKIWLYAGTSEYLPVLRSNQEVTICGVRTISRKG